MFWEMLLLHGLSKRCQPYMYRADPSRVSPRSSVFPAIPAAQRKGGPHARELRSRPMGQ